MLAQVSQQSNRISRQAGRKAFLQGKRGKTHPTSSIECKEPNVRPGELKTLVRLMLPMMGTQLCIMGMGFVDYRDVRSL